MPELNEAQERADFQAALRETDPRGLLRMDFTRRETLAGYSGYVDSAMEQMYAGWQLARRASSAQQVEAVSIDEELELHNDLNRVPGNTTKATADYLFKCGYRKLRQAATGSADGLDAAMRRDQATSRAALEFAANLCRLGAETIKGRDYVRRDAVMNEVAGWRKAWDSAPQVDFRAILAQQGADK